MNHSFNQRGAQFKLKLAGAVRLLPRRLLDSTLRFGYAQVTCPQGLEDHYPVGISQAPGFSLILATMVMGTVTVNRCSEHGRNIGFTIEQAGPVIYVIFFTLVGARFQIALLPTMWPLGIAYVLLRSTVKYLGSWLGGTLGGARPAVRNNLGLGLLSQAGVARGLALASYDRFCIYGEAGEALGNVVLSMITATTSWCRSLVRLV